MEKARILKVGESLHRKVKIAAVHKGCTMREFVESILSEYLNRNETKGGDPELSAAIGK